MLSVVIPVYNERRTFRELLRRVASVGISKEIIVVDDRSNDGTADLLKSLEASPPDWLCSKNVKRIRFLFQERNQGKGAAIRAGIPLASEQFTVIQDADLEYDPNDYFKLLEPLERGLADVVYGSRFAGAHRRVLFFWHTVGNRMLTLASNIFTNLNLTDMETCYKMFRTDILQGIPLRSNRFGFEPEITAKIAKLGCRIYEVPIDYHGRTYAEGKKIGITDAFQALYVILKYWLTDDLYSEGAAGRRNLRIMEGVGKYNEWLFRQCEPFLGKRVLEMGSGTGNITRFLLDKERVLATDVSESQLAELNRMFGSFPNVKVSRLDFTDADAISAMKDERVDTILSMNVLEHIKDDASALRNAFRVLEPGGRLVLLVPAHQSLYSDLDRNIQHHRRYSVNGLLNRLKEAGFSVSSFRQLNFLGALGWFVNGRILRRQLIPSRQARFFNVLLRFLDWEKALGCPIGMSILACADKPFAAESTDRIGRPAMNEAAVSR